MAEAVTVADLFRRAQELRSKNPQGTYKDLMASLASEYDGREFPPIYNLTIPEQDKRAPEEDWSAGLSIIARGIQTRSWKEIASGIVLCLEQTEGYEREHGNTGGQDAWHDRSAGIKDSLAKGISKWMPEDLMRLAEQSKQDAAAAAAGGRANTSETFSRRRVKAGKS